MPAANENQNFTRCGPSPEEHKIGGAGGGDSIWRKPEARERECRGGGGNPKRENARAAAVIGGGADALEERSRGAV